MATATKICKVCGNEYEYCHTIRRVAGVFRWQDVACCPEHGSIYLAKIAASRSGASVEENVAVEDASVVKQVSDFSDLDECDYEEDAWFEDDFEDDEEAE